jgi:hypothetical protein
MSVSTFFTTLKAQIFSFTEQFLSGRCISWEAERMCISSCMTIPCQEKKTKNIEIHDKLKWNFVEAELIVQYSHGHDPSRRWCINVNIFSWVKATPLPLVEV